MHVICVTTHATRSPISSEPALTARSRRGRWPLQRPSSLRPPNPSSQPPRFAHSPRCAAAGLCRPPSIPSVPSARRRRSDRSRHRSSSAAASGIYAPFRLHDFLLCVCVMLCSGLPPHDWASEFMWWLLERCVP